MSVEFTSELPKKDGYYWYVDKTYPQPKVGFVALENFYDCRNNQVTQFVGGFLFIGPKIEYPCTPEGVVIVENLPS